MKHKWSGLAVMAGGLFLILGTAPGCVVRAHVRPAVVVVDEEPPEPQYEAQPAPRAGYVWVQGHWEFRNGRWKWSRGYWKAQRTGYVWVAGHWERRGNRHHWIAGHWQRGGVAPAPRPRPTPPPPANTGGGAVGGVWIDVAPPAPKAEPAPAPRSGYVWVSGRWEYRTGQWKWKRGRWEAVRTGNRWVPGYWDRQGNRYRWVPGHWEATGRGGGGVERRDHRNKRDEPEEVKSRRGRGR